MPVEHKCHICQKVLTRSTILRDHIRSHQEDRSYKCTLCPKAFVRNSDRKDHEKLHTPDHKYKCFTTNKNGTTQGCDAVFHRKHDLNRHWKRKGGASCLVEHPREHLTIGELQTMDAASTLFNIASARTSTLDGRPPTSLALPTNSTPGALVRLSDTPGISRTTTPPVDGGMLDLGDSQHSFSEFRTQGDFSNSADDLERPSSPSLRVQKHPAVFCCTLCSKRFTRSYSLRSHLQVHTDERPFVCRVCGISFARWHSWRRHEGLHSRTKNLVCKGILSSRPDQTWGCGVRFTRADALGRHLRSQEGRRCIRPLLDEEAASRLSIANVERQDTHSQESSSKPTDELTRTTHYNVDNYASSQASSTNVYHLSPPDYLAMSETHFVQYPQLLDIDWSAIDGVEIL